MLACMVLRGDGHSELSSLLYTILAALQGCDQIEPVILLLTAKLGVITHFHY